MDIKSKYTSPLVLNEINILEGSFRRTEGSLDNIELGLKVNRDIIQSADDQYAINLEVTVTDENEKVFVFVKCCGKFQTAQENKELIEKNAIAIMFPYVRSYISTITTQPGMTPIVLPAINIVAMLNDK